MRYTVAALVLTVALPMLGGCGQMGPLYMPPKEPQQSEPAAQPPGEQPQSDDS
ncbi:MAG: hypothetical protein V7700_02240 [Halioglobus sp.]